MARELSIDKVPQLNLEAVRGWDTLKPAEQSVVRQEANALAKDFVRAGELRLAIGEHFSRIRDVLGAKHHAGLWERFMRSKPFGLSRATINRYIQNYEVARTIFPKPILEVALMRDTGMLDRSLIAVNPPPKTRDKEKIIEYLDSLGRGGKAAEAEDDPEVLKQEFILQFCRIFQRLPSHHSTRGAWFRSAAGMMATITGIASDVTISPQAVPDDYRPKPRGRPRMDQGQASEDEE